MMDASRDLTNRNLIRELEKILEIMEKEAKRRGAPVYTLKSELKTLFQNLVAAMLSSRTRDEVTVEAAKRLFERVNGPQDIVKLDISEIEELIKGVGFYRVKARRLKELAEVLIKDYNSEVPIEFEDLIRLPGVGRKTANIVLVSAGLSAIPVDTHVHRIANRLGFVRTSRPEETELELKKIFPPELWNKLNKAFVGFGQTVCRPVKPLCSDCPFESECPKVGVRVRTEKRRRGR
jgi:endonuclease-3